MQNVEVDGILEHFFRVFGEGDSRDASHDRHKRGTLLLRRCRGEHLLLGLLRYRVHLL